MRAEQQGLVERLIAQSALARRNLRLETELAANVVDLDGQTTELQESRRAMVVARDQERPASRRLCAAACCHTSSGYPTSLLLARPGRPTPRTYDKGWI